MPENIYINCPECSEVFLNKKIFANHVRWKHRTDKTSEKYKKFQETLKLSAKRTNDKKFGENGYNKFLTIVRNCLHCNDPLPQTRQYKDRNYCDKPKCYNTSQSISGITAWKNRDKMMTAIKKKPFSPEWINHQGKVSSEKQKKYFSSKGERELLNFLKTELPNIVWSSGGKFKIGDNMYKSIDIYNLDLGIIIEYDGIYHWKNVYGNLELVQQKDKALEDYCNSKKYKLIRINEVSYKKIPNIKQTIIHLIQNRQRLPNITKLYFIPEI